jgi:hypothetical protein
MGAFIALAMIPRPEGTKIAADSISIAKSSPLLWILAAVIFCAAFLWEYGRAKRRQSK